MIQKQTFITPYFQPCRAVERTGAEGVGAEVTGAECVVVEGTGGQGASAEGAGADTGSEVYVVEQ